MKVLKFGGTSVGTVESLRNVKSIVEQTDEPVIVVVSALGGITDKLILTANKAATGSDGYMATFNEITERHHNVINGIVPPEHRENITGKIDGMLSELSDIYRGVRLIRDISPRTLDMIVSYGERMSSTIIEKVIDGALLLDSRKFIKTTNRFGKHVLDAELTHSLIAHAFNGLQARILLCPGFISSDNESHVTNLGRGGSDYTAAILAAALNAHTLEIWTDVDGFMSADPRLIKTARIIDSLSFIEAMELCNFGAKVIYPPTIYPVFHKNIPIYIKNTFNPLAPGTRISDDAKQKSENNIKGISSISDSCLVSVSGKAVVPQETETRALNTLSRNGITVFLVSKKSGKDTVSFAIRKAELTSATMALQNEFSSELETGEINPLEIKQNLATVAIVGENVYLEPGIVEKITELLSRNGVEIIAFAQGKSETNLSFVVELQHQTATMNAVHEALFTQQ